MSGPPVTGFAVRIGPAEAAASPVPRLAMRGQAMSVRSGGTGLRCSGWVVTSPPARPLLASAEGVTVLLAGEIYHADALRAAVGPAADGTGAGAELLLACYLRYGPEGLRLVDGRFAAVLIEDGTVVVATDHAGSVPLYLRYGPAAVEVATEAKALVGTGSAATRPLPGAEPAPAPAGVHRVRAGTALTLSPATGAAAALATWRPPVHRLAVPEADAVAALSATLDRAIRTRLDADRPTALISGGIDSGAVAALARRAAGAIRTVSMGTDRSDEFAPARVVADALSSEHTEYRLAATDVIRALPWAVAAAETVDAEVLEYLLPLVALYRELPAAGLRILTGYGADIPLGGMHRGTRRLGSLDGRIATDMACFDGLNELSPVLGGLAGHWTTHPFWDRAVLDLLTSLEPGLKRRHGMDKWVLREAMRGLLPDQTVGRPKLGIHESSGVTSIWTSLLLDAGVAKSEVPIVKQAMAIAIHQRVVGAAEPPGEVSFDAVLHAVLTADPLVVAR
jgi:(carboxyethyl)arginine beta-lactam-synthase